MILRGYVQQVVDADSVVSCKIQCLQAQDTFNFPCRSAMFYPEVSVQGPFSDIQHFESVTLDFNFVLGSNSELPPKQYNQGG